MDTVPKYVLFYFSFVFISNLNQNYYFSISLTIEIKTSPSDFTEDFPDQREILDMPHQ